MINISVLKGLVEKKESKENERKQGKAKGVNRDVRLEKKGRKL